MDKFSLLHFATGIIAYFWGMSLSLWAGTSAGIWFLAHGIFEIAENTQYGMNFINKNIPLWPGGKYSSDTVTNMIGDQIYAMIGWGLAYMIDSNRGKDRGKL